MEYTNPEIPEGINTSREHPLKEFATLTGGVLLVVALAVGALALLADVLAQRIPFSYEVALASAYEDSLPVAHPARGQLQALADRLGRVMELPEGMAVTVHLVEKDIVNAQATLGGHVLIYRGLLEALPHENALAMVMAHEIAHIQHRHPIRSLGRGIVIGLALTALLDVGGDNVAGGALEDAGLLTLLTFSRSQEAEADRTALEAVAALYGHVAGSLDLYEVFMKKQADDIFQPPAFLSTHPLTEDRMAELADVIRHRAWTENANTTPLARGLYKAEP